MCSSDLVLPGQHLADLGLLYKAQLDQGIAEAHSGVFLLQKGLSQLFLGDQPFAEKDLAELVLVNRNARRTQLIEIEGTKMGVGDTPVKAGRRKAVWRPTI